MYINKRFFSNLLNLGSVEVLGLLIPIITMPLLTRGLGEDLYGTYLYLLTFSLFANTVIDFGTNIVAVRTVSEFKGKKEKLYKLFNDTQSLRLILALTYISAVCGFFYIFGDVSKITYVIALIVPYCIGYALIPTWYYHGLSELKLITISQLFIKVLNLLYILFFLSGQEDFLFLLLTYSISVLALGLYFTIYLRYKEKQRFRFTFKIVETLKSNLPVFIGLLAPNFYNTLPTIALGTIYPPAQFALLAVAIRLCSIVVIIQNVVSRALYPLLIQESILKVGKLLQLYTCISLPLIIFISVFGTTFLEIFLGQSYGGVTYYLVILSIGVMFLGWTNALSQGYFLVKGMDTVYRNVSLRVSLVACVLSFLLIHMYGILGGALSITIARVLFFVDYYVMYKINENK
ncbi:oligosaccharide flippase family protein [Photobacterium sanguinicancri]|uniref:oligosaccharide flippase family protein n=1 Tax=Photobacterium sanguinicancri TaxID=875932 RepID=UPI0026E31E6D|nr:oligosaccharide flippase family protein [Photobacterium sanguinicancri]MDO6499528.1 oligosaccharide flippase family protein [Photobacterium sanguinicancri]